MESQAAATSRELLMSMKNCNILQHTATHCNKYQHTATPCNTLQNILVLIHAFTDSGNIAGAVDVHEKLQHTATYCHILQQTPTHCNTLQHPATPLDTYPCSHRQQQYRGSCGCP